jgi:hypothetical protein
MVLHEMMLIVAVNGGRGSVNLTPILIPVFRGLMQKWLHFFVKVALALTL